MSNASATAPLDPAKFRPDFPILSRCVRDDVPLIYFDNAASTQRPAQVIRTIVECYEEHYANVHRGIHQLAQESDEMFEEAREKVRAFINAPTPEQCIFTSGSTAGINLVARTWGDASLHAGDEILTSEMEHHSNLVPWQQLAGRTGAVLRHIPLSDDGLLRLDQLDALLTERTKLLAVTAVSNVLGTINPLGELVPRAHQAGAVVLVDGAQSVPHRKTDVQALDCDFLVLSGHKMLGPSGVGVLYGKRDLLERMPPFLGGGGMIRRVLPDRFEPGDLPAKFEAGTPPIVSAIGLGTAIDYLNQVGLEAVAAHERRLTERAHQVLSQIEGLRILGPPPDKKTGIVSFTLGHIHAHDVAEVLDRRGIAVRAGHHCTMPLHQRYGVTATARASFYLYNTLAEVEQLGPALEQVQRVFHRRKKDEGGPSPWSVVRCRSPRTTDY
ncbi:MAG: cysteine desulfurase [Thermoguttaceae bacterium]|jgi:cysteine desulfurase/selenocysteine lyase